MKRYLRIYKQLLKMNFEVFLHYRSSVLFVVLGNMSYLLTFLIGFKFMFSSIMNLDYKYETMFTFIVFGQIWWALNSVFVRKGFQMLAEQIYTGKLDSWLVKPISIRGILPIWGLRFHEMVSALVEVGLLFLIIDITQFSPKDILIGLFFFLVGLIITHSFIAIVVSNVFVTGKNDSFFTLLAYLIELVHLPIVFYPMALKVIFTTIIPVLLIINPVVLSLFGELDLSLVVNTIGIAVVYVILANIAWNWGLRHYTSAN